MKRTLTFIFLITLIIYFVKNKLLKKDESNLFEPTQTLNEIIPKAKKFTEIKNLTQKSESNTGTITQPKQSTKNQVKPKKKKMPKNIGFAEKAKILFEENLIEFKVTDDGKIIAYGDIILGELEEGQDLKGGVVEASPVQFWDGPIIQYYIDEDFDNTQRIQQAIEYFHRHTPLKFIPYEGRGAGLIFKTDKEHCYSYLGKVVDTGLQPIYLGPKCHWGSIIHEIMHALGFIHEQSRPDRDEYIEILWDNIDPEFTSQFFKLPVSMSDSIRGYEFDYQSVMLYPPNAFAKDKNAITIKSEGAPLRPTREGLSAQDKQRLYEIYGE